MSRMSRVSLLAKEIETSASTNAKSPEISALVKSIDPEKIKNVVNELDNGLKLLVNNYSLTEFLNSQGLTTKSIGLICKNTQSPWIKKLCIIDMIGRISKIALLDQIKEALKVVPIIPDMTFPSIPEKHQQITESISGGLNLIEDSVLYIFNTFLCSGTPEFNYVWKSFIPQKMKEKYGFDLIIDDNCEDLSKIGEFNKFGILFSMNYHCSTLFDYNQVDFFNTPSITKESYKGANVPYLLEKANICPKTQCPLGQTDKSHFSKKCVECRLLKSLNDKHEEYKRKFVWLRRANELYSIGNYALANTMAISFLEKFSGALETEGGKESDPAHILAYILLISTNFNSGNYPIAYEIYTKGLNSLSNMFGEDNPLTSELHLTMLSLYTEEQNWHGAGEHAIIAVNSSLKVFFY